MHSSQANLELEALLDYLKHNRGCDLTGYKRSVVRQASVGKVAKSFHV